MPFFSGKDIRLFITVEATGSSIKTGSNNVSTSTGSPSSTDFVPALGTAITYAGSNAKFPNIQSIELVKTAEFEDVDIVGRSTQEHLRVRPAYEITLTRPVGDVYWALIYDRADSGVKENSTATDSWYPSTDKRATTSGFRLHLWVSTDSCYTFQNATVREHRVSPVPGEFTKETLIFQGNLWLQSSSAYTSSTPSSDL